MTEVIFVAGDINIRNAYIKYLSIPLLKSSFKEIKAEVVKPILFFEKIIDSPTISYKEINQYFKFINMLSEKNILLPEVSMSIIRSHMEMIKYTINNYRNLKYVDDEDESEIEVKPRESKPPIMKIVNKIQIIKGKKYIVKVKVPVQPAQVAPAKPAKVKKPAQIPLFIIEVNPLSLFEILYIDKNIYANFYNEIVQDMNALNLKVIATIVCSNKKLDIDSDIAVDNNQWVKAEQNLFYKYYDRSFGDLYIFDYDKVSYRKIADKKTLCIQPSLNNSNKFLVCVDGYIGTNKRLFMEKIAASYDKSSRIILLETPDFKFIQDCDFEIEEKNRFITDYILEQHKKDIIKVGNVYDNVIFIMEGNFLYRKWLNRNIYIGSTPDDSDSSPKIDLSALYFLISNNINICPIFVIKQKPNANIVRSRAYDLLYPQYIKKYNMLYMSNFSWYNNKLLYLIEDENENVKKESKKETVKSSNKKEISIDTSSKTDVKKITWEEKGKDKAKD